MDIRTKRFLLRDFGDEDLVAFSGYHADPRFLEYYSDREAEHGHACELIELFQTWAREQPRMNYQLAIISISSGNLVGCAGLRRAGAPERTAEIGIELAPEYWGRFGFAVEVLAALVEFGFGPLDLTLVYGKTVSANSSIGKHVEALGAVAVAKPTPNWMSAKGWLQIEWELTRKAWAGRRLTSILSRRFAAGTPASPPPLK